jgi:siroheme synthase-like protein
MPTQTISLLMKLQSTHGIVVGQDALAEDWARFAASQEATVDLLHPAPSDQFQKEASEQSRLRWLPRDLTPEGLQACDWLIVTSTDRALCETVSRLAHENHVWHAVIHFPELGNLLVPRVFNLDAMQIVLPLGTSRPPKAETISRSWRRFLPPDFSRALEVFKSIEKKVEEQIHERKFRPRVFDSLFDSHLSELICAGQWEAAEALTAKVLQSYSQNPERRQRISPRIGVQLAVHFQVEGHQHSGKLFNLSRDGAFIATKSVLPKLTHVTAIEFVLPSGSTIAKAEGFVVWENAAFDPRVPIYPPGIALMFDSLPPESVSAIEQYVKSQLKEP